MTSSERQKEEYIVMEMFTGAVDGRYMNKQSALEVLEYWRSEFPKGRWVILTPAFDLNSQMGINYVGIPDSNFAADKFGTRRGGFTRSVFLDSVRALFYVTQTPNQKASEFLTFAVPEIYSRSIK